MSDTSPGECPTVLIVDDDAAELVALESILLTLDVNVVTARSGREALRRVLERDFAVVLLDVRMPGMDGFETAALIRQGQRSVNTPIIFMTAFTEEMYVPKGHALRAVDYITAPVKPEVLRTKVSVLVELFRASVEVRRQVERLRRRTAQLHRLAAASLAINSAGSLDAMTSVATASAVEILDATVACGVVDIGDRHATHTTGTLRGPTGAVDAPLGAEVRRTNRIARLAWECEGTERHVLGVPLVDRTGANIGSVEVVGGVGDAFDGEDEDLLVQLAHMTSIAVENAVAREAREADRLMDEFVAAVSHELRTPLNALRSWAWMLRQQALPADSIATVAEAVERSVAAQARIIDDLLDVSRITTGKMSLRLEPVDLGPIVGEAVEALASAAETQGVELLRIPGSAPLLVAGDADRLRQVVSNLVSNAIKFTPAGGRVEVALAADGPHARLRVRDSGCGIASTFLPRVFERFRRADGSARRAGGLGVGLTIVRRLVEMHGGGVTAHSDGEGKGSTFTVTIPLVAVTPVTAGQGGGAARLDGARLLLVEDDPDTRNVMVLVLSAAGASVATAGTAEEALAQVVEHPFDALLCDIGLPGEDGYSFLRRARATVERVRHVPAVALSALARTRDKQLARDAGFDGHLAKPVDPTQLLRTLGEILPGRRPEAPDGSGSTERGAARTA